MEKGRPGSWARSVSWVPSDHLHLIKLFISAIWSAGSSVFNVENMIEARGKYRGLLQTTQPETAKFNCVFKYIDILSSLSKKT